MGRPLNKKYFGNRNIGATSTTSDDFGIGGEGLNSYTLPGQKGVVAINNTYKYFPTLNIPAPDLPGGVQATATVVWEVNTVSIAGGTTYTAGTITSITGLDGYADTPTRFTITAPGGVPAFNAFTNRGEYTSIDGTAITTWAVIGPGGDGAAQATITFRLKSITTVNRGSGYSVAPSFTTANWQRASSQTAGGQTQTGAPSVALTADTGDIRSATNQENAVIMTGYLTGGSALATDVIKQVSTNRYKVTDGTRTGIVKLVAKASGSLVAGEANLIATDASSNTYYVTKLTGHKALLTRTAGAGEFATGASVEWTMNGTSGTKVYDNLPYLATGVNVQIANG